MKTIINSIIILFLAALTFTSCRDVDNDKTAQEEQVENMIEDADNVEVKEDKVKIESPDGSETKVKYDENGDIEKVKTDDNT